MERTSQMWTDVTGRLTAFWAAQSRQTRLMLLASIAVGSLAVAAFLALTVLRRPDYTTLFGNLSADDAAAITQKLKDEKVPYELADGGTTVRVPTEKVYEERVALAGAGVVKGGGTGYELFDRTNFGMTDFQEKIAKTRAIEGELQRTIMALTPVETARVHIAQPEAGLYTAAQQPPTASVVIRTKYGMRLTPDEVKGITLLVSGAVEGLKPESVTIIDHNGSVLVPASVETAAGSGPGGANALKLTDDQLNAKQRYEAAVQQNVQSLLDATLGPHRVAVRVATEMSFDANTTETESYAPKGTIRSEQTEDESYAGGGNGAPAAGVPGTTTNVVGTYQGAQNGQQGNYRKSKATRNYEITKENRKHIDAPGKVQRTSIAVLVNVPKAPLASAPAPLPVVARTAAAKGATTTVPLAVPTAPPYTLTPQNVQQIRNIVIAATGLNLAASDRVTVESLPFNPEVTTDELPAVVAPATILGLPVTTVAAAGGGLLFLLVLLVATKLRRRKPAAEAIETHEVPSFDSTLAGELPPFDEHQMLQAPPELGDPVRSASELTREQMIEYVTNVAHEKPEDVAKLVKLWLAE